MEQKNHHSDGPAGEPGNPRQGMPADPFPLGVYPVFDDDLPRDTAFEDFSAPDLRDMRVYPWGLG